MKKFLCFCFIVLSFSCFNIKPVNWHNTDITTDVSDQDIDIIGANNIIGGITVSALTRDVTITVTTEDSVLTGSGESQLYLQVADNNKISFNLEYNLSFKGSNDGIDLLITVSGQGYVEFLLGNGKKVSFTSTGASGGTRLFVRIQSGIDNIGIEFLAKDNDRDENVEIIVGPKSILSYIALETDTDGESYISFEPENRVDKKGRMVLRIEDTGAVYIGGNKVDDVFAPTLSNIHMDVPAGREAQFIVRGEEIGSIYWESLLILNFNKMFTDLLINPWRQQPDPFAGNRYGFVMGPDSRLFVMGAYLDYVALANNICPQPDIPEDILGGKLVSEAVKKRNPSAFIIDGRVDLNPAHIVLGYSSGIYFRSGVDKYGNINEYGVDMDFSFTVDKDAKTPGEGEIVFDIEGELAVEVSSVLSSIGVLNILSLEVTPTGGRFLPSQDSGCLFNLSLAPKRTFKRDVEGAYITYNKATFLINNSMGLLQVRFLHTDENHTVCENNDVISEPSYVGGESFLLDSMWGRPTIQFFNSTLYVHTDVAFTGVDLLISNTINLNSYWVESLSKSNISKFIFFG